DVAKTIIKGEEADRAHPVDLGRPRSEWATALGRMHSSGTGLAEPDPDASYVAHMEGRVSRGRGCWPLSGWRVVECGCGSWGGPGVRGFATVGHAHIRGLGTPRPLFVARPLSKVERGARVGVAQATNRGVVVREPGVLGPPRQPQRECRFGLARVGEPFACGRYGCRFERGGAGSDLPAVGGEFAGDRDGDDPAGFAAGVFELAPAGVEATLRTPGDVDDLGWVAALAALERFTDGGA